MAYTGRNDTLIWTDGSGKIDIRSSENGRILNLIRVSDGMPLQQFVGDLTAAQGRANAMVAAGTV